MALYLDQRTSPLNRRKAGVLSTVSRFKHFQAESRVRVWRRLHEDIDPSFHPGTVGASVCSVMAWFAFCWN